MANNLYYLTYDDKYLLDIEINRIIDQEEVDSFNIVRYVYDDEDPQEILIDINTPTFLNEKKMVIIFNPLFLDSNYKEKNIADAFTNIFNSEREAVLVICQKDNVSNNNITKELRKNAKCIEIKSFKDDDLGRFIRDKVKADGFEIDGLAVDELILRTDGIISNIINEIDKLENYRLEEKKISHEDVLNLVSANIEDDIYELLNAFVASDKKKIMALYDNFKFLNTDELYIINSISKKLEEMLYTKYLLEEKLTKDEIASYFNVNPKRAYYMILNANKYSIKKLNEVIDRINKLDFEIKSGKVDKGVGLELFLLGA